MQTILHSKATMETTLIIPINKMMMSGKKRQMKNVKTISDGRKTKNSM